jgi:hypothetical protein
MLKDQLLVGKNMGINKRREAVQKLQSHAKNLGIFANFETLGTYDDFSQLVMLDYLDEQGFLQLLKLAKESAVSANYESMKRFYSTSVHEFTHWLDHTSTLWGQRQLIFIYNAINAWTNQKEQDFYRIAISNSERYRARLAVYYTEDYKINLPKTVTQPWQYEYGSGLEFGIDGRPREDRPFIYTVFSNSDNKRIFRVPFSMFALTELNATYAELRVKGQMFASLDNDSRLVEESRFRQELIGNLYNSGLVIYSVGVHCLANSIKIDEVFQAYEHSSALATLCLNLPRELYYSLSVPKDFNVLGNRVQALQKLADPGFAFFSIAKQAPKYQQEVPIEDWLEEALKNAGLPKLEIIIDLILVQMKELETEIIDGIYTEQLKNLLSVGRQNFIQRGIWGQNGLSMETLTKTPLILPPIVLADGYTIPLVENTIFITQKDMDKWIEKIFEIEISMDEFIRACRF